MLKLFVDGEQINRVLVVTEHSRVALGYTYWERSQRQGSPHHQILVLS